MWFHLSQKKWKVDAITELRRTKKGYGELQVDRFSVAPTVGRAYIGCPHAVEGKPLFIYQVHVKKPVPTTGTADFEMTREHLITEAVLASEGGKIPVNLVGQVLVGPDESVYLKVAYRCWNFDMTHEEEHQVLWDVQEGIWRFRRPSRAEATETLAELRSAKEGNR